MAVQETSEGQVSTMREESRRHLALKLLYLFAAILTVAIIVSAVLIWNQKLTFDNAMTLILAITSTFSGLLGSAITFYFSSNSNS